MTSHHSGATAAPDAPAPTADRAADRAVSQAADDPALRALAELRSQIRRSVRSLQAADERLGQLAELRAAGLPWLEIVSTERRPLVVETITRVLEDLGEVGSYFRREEARALQRENVSIHGIGRLFGVTRQRISALVRDRDVPVPRRES